MVKGQRRKCETKARVKLQHHRVDERNFRSRLRFIFSAAGRLTRPIGFAVVYDFAADESLIGFAVLYDFATNESHVWCIVCYDFITAKMAEWHCEHSIFVQS